MAIEPLLRYDVPSGNKGGIIIGSSSERRFDYSVYIADYLKLFYRYQGNYVEKSALLADNKT